MLMTPTANRSIAAPTPVPTLTATSAIWPPSSPRSHMKIGCCPGVHESLERREPADESIDRVFDVADHAGQIADELTHLHDHGRNQRREEQRKRAERQQDRRGKCGPGREMEAALDPAAQRPQVQRDQHPRGTAG